MSTISQIFNSIKNSLFPWLEEALDPLSEKERKFIQVVSLINLEIHMKQYRWKGKGRKRTNRISLAKTFVAKSINNEAF